MVAGLPPGGKPIGKLAAKNFDKLAGPVAKLFSKAPRAPRGTMETFSSGSGRYLGGPKLSIDDAYRLGREHGIDMRQFKLVYAPGNEYDFGSVGRYFNPRTLEPGDIVRAADGRIELRLFDKALRSPQDLIETLSHELNHVREFYKTGVFSSESAAEAAAEAARPFIRPR